MNRLLAICALGTVTSLLAPACGSDDDVKRVPGTPQGGDGAGGEPARGGTGTGEGGEPGTGAHAGTAPIAGGAGGAVEVAGAGVGGAPLPGGAGDSSVGGEAGGGGEGGVAVGGEGGAGGSGGDSVTGNVIYATFGTKLVWIEPDTAVLHEVGDLRNAAGDVTYSEVVLAYGNVPGEAWIATPRYDATADRPPPELGKINLCTGVVSELSTLTRVGVAPTAIEGLALAPSGTWYVSTGDNPPGATQYITDKLGTLNVATRVITDLTGTVNTLQDDMDSMVFVGATLYGIDVATGNSKLELVTVDLPAGTVTSVGAPTSSSATAVPLRIAYDATRALAYGWRESDRNLLTLSLTTGAATAVGETHAVGVYPGQSVQGFTVAPVCP